MIGYKGFDKDFKCRDMQYEVGKTYIEKEAKLCEKGLHFCENPLDVFAYYSPANGKFAEIEADDVSPETGDDSKRVAKKLTVKTEINLFKLVKLGVEYIKAQIDWDNNKESNTGNYSAATNTGNYSAATNTGNYSAATNTGNCSAATNTGDYSAATNTGDYSAATNTGNCSAATNTGNCSAATNTGNCSAATNTGNYSAATNTGNCSAATNTGNCSAATNTGYRSAATNTGNYSAATNTGNCSAATNTGYRSAAIVDEKESVAVSLGAKGRAKGNVGCWIVLAEWDTESRHRIDVKSFYVDGEKVKANTFYVLRNGELVEYSDET